MSDDSDIDDVVHEQLLKNISSGKSLKTKVRKSVGKVTTDDLLDSLKTAKQTTNEAKKSLALERKEARKSGANKTIAAPLHRQERERIQGAVGFIELKKDINVWRDVVESNRLADQLQFPLHQERVLSVDTAADKNDGFRPRTEMELEMSALLNNSKHNLKNDTVYTEAELEIIKAMNLKEAKEKLASMQKMRALVSYREAKHRYAAKIKSKGYHRILKRQKRKQLVKEFDELLVRDPEAAKEKLQELENMRVLERGSLRHHARSKFQKEILKHAGKDPAAKKVLEEHLRLGRELKNKVGLESESEESETDEPAKKKSIGDLLKSAALAAAEEEEAEKEFDTAESRQHLYEMRAKKRAEMEKARVKKEGASAPAEKTFEEDNDWTIVSEEPSVSKTPAKKTKKKRKAAATVSEEAEAPADTTTESPVVDDDIDVLFDAAEGKLVEKIQKEARAIRASEKVDEPVKKKKKVVKKKETEEAAAPSTAVDISLDPKNFLQVETSNLSKVSADLMDKMDEFDDDQERLVAEAFKDDDVIGEFEQEKEFVEEGERPKDVDLTLQGWGCWVGPGMTDRKRRKQFVVKAKQKKRRDEGKRGVIIRESGDQNIQKLQPKSLPFPYTRVEDFQAVMSQPIGKEWNPVGVSRELCKPSVVTQGGRSIRPIDKAEAIKKTMHDSDDEE